MEPSWRGRNEPSRPFDSNDPKKKRKVSAQVYVYRGDSGNGIQPRQPSLCFQGLGARSLPCQSLGLYGALTEQGLGLNLAIDFSASGLNTDESKAVKNKFDREVKPRFPIYQSSSAPHESHSYLLSNGLCRVHILVSTEPLPSKA
jgi:hypothetical protein